LPERSGWRDLGATGGSLNRCFASILLGLCTLTTACTTAPTAGRAPQLVPGAFVPGTQPDGNSVILDAPAGLIVVDTGRHRSHTQAVLAVAKERNKPIAAVINTHWHLDHIGGNALVRETFPNVRIYASGALEEALAGFLASYASQLRSMAGTAKSPEERQALNDELALIDAGPRLAPSEVISVTGAREIAGRSVLITLEKDAVTAGDLWIIDAESGTLIAGDLVTLPFPFLDTACPARWRAVLERISAAPFSTLIPGHGPAMSRQDFRIYRTAFERLLDCAASSASTQACTDDWLRDAGPLVPEAQRPFTRQLAGYYISSSLRAPAEKQREYCGH
jgi:glyoxylase-like metal-dependent hydrolase (beta-lactamase superfamily II)